MSQHRATHLIRSSLIALLVTGRKWLPGILMVLGASFGAVLDPATRRGANDHEHLE